MAATEAGSRRILRLSSSPTIRMFRDLQGRCELLWQNNHPRYGQTSPDPNTHSNIRIHIWNKLFDQFLSTHFFQSKLTSQYHHTFFYSFCLFVCFFYFSFFSRQQVLFCFFTKCSNLGKGSESWSRSQDKCLRNKKSHNLVTVKRRLKSTLQSEPDDFDERIKNEWALARFEGATVKDFLEADMRLYEPHAVRKRNT